MLTTHYMASNASNGGSIMDSQLQTNEMEAYRMDMEFIAKNQKYFFLGDFTVIYRNKLNKPWMSGLDIKQLISHFSNLFTFDDGNMVLSKIFNNPDHHDHSKMNNNSQTRYDNNYYSPANINFRQSYKNKMYNIRSTHPDNRKTSMMEGMRNEMQIIAKNHHKLDLSILPNRYREYFHHELRSIYSGKLKILAQHFSDLWDLEWYRSQTWLTSKVFNKHNNHNTNNHQNTNNHHINTNNINDFNPNASPNHNNNNNNNNDNQHQYTKWSPTSYRSPSKINYANSRTYNQYKQQDKESEQFQTQSPTKNNQIYTSPPRSISSPAQQFDAEQKDESLQIFIDCRPIKDELITIDVFRNNLIRDILYQISNQIGVAANDLFLKHKSQRLLSETILNEYNISPGDTILCKLLDANIQTKSKYIKFNSEISESKQNALQNTNTNTNTNTYTEPDAQEDNIDNDIEGVPSSSSSPSRNDLIKSLLRTNKEQNEEINKLKEQQNKYKDQLYEIQNNANNEIKKYKLMYLKLKKESSNKIISLQSLNSELAIKLYKLQNNIKKQQKTFKKKEKEKESEDERDIICKEKFKYWLCSVVKLKQYLPLFQQQGYDNVILIEFFDEDIICNEIKIPKKLHCKLILKRVTEFKSTVRDFKIWIENNKFNIHKQQLTKNGILTLNDLQKDIKSLIDIKTTLKVNNDKEITEIFNTIQQTQQNYECNEGQI